MAKRSLLYIPLVLALHLAFTAFALYCIFSLLEEYLCYRHLSVEFERPSSLEKSKKLIEQLKRHYAEHYILLLIFHCVGFLFLQTWCIPGTFFFNLFAGAIFGIGIGWPLCLFLNAFGAFMCYCISGLYGAGLLETKYLKKHVGTLTAFMQRQSLSGNTLFYLVSFRLIPMSPNWAMNITFPHIGVGPLEFIASVALGLAPWNYISCSAGVIISDIVAQNQVMTTQNYLLVSWLAERVSCSVRQWPSSFLPQSAAVAKEAFPSALLGSSN